MKDIVKITGYAQKKMLLDGDFKIHRFYILSKRFGEEENNIKPKDIEDFDAKNWKQEDFFCYENTVSSIDFNGNEDKKHILQVRCLIPKDSGGYTIRSVVITDNENKVCFFSNYPDLKKPDYKSQSATEIEIELLIGLHQSQSKFFLQYNDEKLLFLKSEHEDYRKEIESKFKKVESVFSNYIFQQGIKEKLSYIARIGTLRLLTRDCAPYERFFLPYQKDKEFPVIAGASIRRVLTYTRHLFPLEYFFIFSEGSLPRLVDIFNLFKGGRFLSVLDSQNIKNINEYNQKNASAYHYHKLVEHSHVINPLSFESDESFVKSVNIHPTTLYGQGYSVTKSRNYKKVKGKTSSGYTESRGSVVDNSKGDVHFTTEPKPAHFGIRIGLVSDYILDFFGIDFSEKEWNEIKKTYNYESFPSLEEIIESKKNRESWIEKHNLYDFLKIKKQ